MTLNELAWKILRDADCDEYTYGGAESENIMKDLMSVFEPGNLAPYTYLEVANEILSFSHPRPIERKPYRVIWDIWDACDADKGWDTLEEAKEAVMDLYRNWLAEGLSKIKDINNLTEDEWLELDGVLWNNAEVQKYNPMTDEYEDEWFPTDELIEIGWVLPPRPAFTTNKTKRRK